MVLKVGKKEYKIKYAYEPVLKCRIISRLVRLVDNEDADLDLTKVEDVLLFLPDMLLVGLQKFHKDEFGFNYITGEGREESLSKAFALIEDYSDESGDLVELFSQLQNELLENGFLSSLFQKEQKQIESVEKAVTDQEKK